MAGRVAGKVAFVTGATRGQGRSHALRLAEEGADIIAVDILQDYETVSYGMGTEQDLADTVKAVEGDKRACSDKSEAGTGGDRAAVRDRTGGFRRVTRGYCCCQTAYTTPFPARCTPDRQESTWPSSSSRPRSPRPSTARR
jgi:NAD(P)-dependent dehydrogenase (short-subunit alcohol dehydrogenase family)